MSVVQEILFGVVVLITHFIEGITGFGCTVLALPFATSLAGIKTAVPVLTIVAFILALYIVIIDFRQIVWKEYGRIVIYVLLGLPVGMWLFSNMPDRMLKLVLALFMVGVSVRGLYTSYREQAHDNGCCPAAATVNPDRPTLDKKKVNPDSRLKRIILPVLLILGGIVHGAFSSGGPFIVIYATKALPDKGKFRATLCLLWVTLNGIKMISDLIVGTYTAPVTRLTLITLPFLAVGMILGNLAHHRIQARNFIKLVYGILLLSGLFMLAGTLGL
jgi:uncharacterized membrane protein YfcA